MAKYYGHHPNPTIADPDDYYPKGDIDTLTQESSANALVRAEEYANTGDAATLASANTYSEEASANAFNQVETNIYDNPDWNNGWYKDVAFFTTITSAAPSAAYQIDAIPGNTFVKAHIIGLGGLGQTKHAAYTLQAFFAVPGGTPPVEKIGATTVLFEQESDTNWFADIDMDVSDNYINILVQGDLVDWIVTVEWLIQPIII